MERSPMSALLALILAVSQGFAAPQGAMTVESSRKTLLEAFRVRELYAASEYPAGCLQWLGSHKGDSVLFVPKLSKAGRCGEVPAVEEKWMVTKPNKVFLVEEEGRVALESFMPIRDGAGAAVSPDDSQENVIDVILAGGGGSFRKGPRSRSGQFDKQADAPGAEHKPRARVEAPKPSDIALSGDSGVRSPESIVRVIRQHVGGFRYAYELHLKTGSTLTGRIALRFSISPAGDVVAVSILSSTTANPRFDEEIKRRIRRMKFDQIETGTCQVTYAIVFERQ